MCTPVETRENVSDQVTIGFFLACDWPNRKRAFFFKADYSVKLKWNCWYPELLESILSWEFLETLTAILISFQPVVLKGNL